LAVWYNAHMPVTATFTSAYNKLNPAQREAVDTIEGPVMVVAGPGTGKTQILALRIANILLQTDTKPQQILALTFTESGVASMRRRLLEIIGTPAYQVVISTFHGFCNEVIGRYPESFPRIIGATAITEVDQVKVLKEIINTLPLKELKPYINPHFYVRPLLSAINSLKREGLAPAEFAKIVDTETARFKTRTDLHHEKGAHKGKMKSEHQATEKRLAKNAELSKIYAAYQEQLAALGFYDFNDMIVEVVRALASDEELRLALQETHQYFLVDEHQDTNRAQNKVLELLCDYHTEPNLFVVGDEKQAIFRFQGASLENFLYFKKLYPQAKLIVLEDNYRSSQTILDSAHSVLAGDKKLQARAGHDEHKLALYALGTPAEEAYFVATDIKAALEAGTPPEEVAVLYRDNRDSTTLVPVLEKLGIPFRIESDQDILADADIKKLLAILSAVNDFGNDELLAAALHVDFFEVAPLDLYKLLRASRDSKLSLYDAAAKYTGSKELGAAMGKLAHYAQAAHNLNLTQFLELVIRDSGFLATMLSRADGVEKLDKLNALFDSVQAVLDRNHGATLGDFFDYLEVLREHDLMIKAGQAYDLAGRVRLMTAHRSKGLEFDRVYIVQCADGHWGNKHRPELLPLPPEVYSLTGAAVEADASNSDERRLFYVALTRARRQVIISYARTRADGKEQLPSQFITELDQSLIENKDISEITKSYAENREKLFVPVVSSGTRLDDKEFVKAVFEKNGLSVTALNNYLACPWKYFYSNLVRLPQAKVKHQMYGTAVHGALKDLFTEVHTKDQFLEKFAEYLNKETLSDKELEESLAKGRLALGGYYDKYNSSWHRDVLTEYNIPDIEIALGLRLTGKVDKIELLDEGKAVGPERSRRVNVVDYKTGKHKSRNEIEGKTASSNGDIKRQLVFYNLLLNKLAENGGEKYQMISGEIDFVEPSDKGEYRRERFEVTPEEITELEELIKKTTDEILNLSFWDGGCGEKDCEYCALRALMR
jgi:DNA helicase II / ATP-dependent DNA helicase PcrA